MMLIKINTKNHKINAQIPSNYFNQIKDNFSNWLAEKEIEKGHLFRVKLKEKQYFLVSENDSDISYFLSKYDEKKINTLAKTNIKYLLVLGFLKIKGEELSKDKNENKLIDDSYSYEINFVDVKKKFWKNRYEKWEYYQKNMKNIKKIVNFKSEYELFFWLVTFNIFGEKYFLNKEDNFEPFKKTYVLEDIQKNDEYKAKFKFKLKFEFLNDFDLFKNLKTKKKNPTIGWSKEEKHGESLNSNITNINDFFDLESNPKLPFYQRKYDWEEGKINQLISDIKSIEKHPIFIGSVLIERSEKEKTGSELDSYILDGQQRLTTIILIILKIEQIIDFFEIESNEKISDKNGFYKTIINFKIEDRWVELKDKVKIQFEDKKSIESFYLNLIENVLLNKIVIKEKMRFKNISLFEKINSNSLQLKEFDFLKLVLLSFIDQKEKTKYLKKASDTIDDLFQKRGKETLNFSRFVIFLEVVNSTKGDIRFGSNSQKFLSIFKKLGFKDKMKITSWEEKIFTFKKFVDEYKTMTLEEEMKIKSSDSNFYDFFNTLLNKHSMSPIVWHIVYKNNNSWQEKRKLLFFLEKFDIFTQNSLYGYSLGQNFNDLFSKINEKKSYSFDEFTKIFLNCFEGYLNNQGGREIFDEEIMFEKWRKNGDISYKSGSKFISILLLRLNFFQMNSNSWLFKEEEDLPNFSLFKEVKKINIEHIHPQSKKETLEDGQIHCLGNLMLIFSKINSKMGKKDFSDKIKDIKKDTGPNFRKIENIKKILMKEEWGTNEINEREKYMIDILKDIYSFKKNKL